MVTDTEAPAPAGAASAMEASGAGSTDGTAAAAAAVLDKLASMDVLRKVEREKRREESRAAADPRESVAQFLRGFAGRQKAVEEALQRMLLEQQQQQQQQQQGHTQQLQPASSGGAPPGDQPQLVVSSATPELVASSLELLTAEVLSMEQSTAAASYYLPSYDQKQCASTVAALRASIEGARTTLAPRKRFAFGSKKVSKVKAEDMSAAAASSSAPTAPGPAPDAAAATAGTSHASSAPPSEPASHSGQPSASTSAPDRSSSAQPLVISEQDRALVARGRGLMGLQDVTVVKSVEEVSGSDFVLLGLTRCVVVLLGHLPALRLAGLRGCTVVAGPVTGACFVDDVQDSTLTLATYQVRVHRTHGTDLFLRARSKPIVEHCSRVRVAPWDAGVAADPRVAALLGEHKLGEETGCWQQVDDFGWIKASQSPNWSVMPEAERPAPPPALPEGVWASAGAGAGAGHAAGGGAGAAAAAGGALGEDEL